uniref:Atos homolog protein A n=1 Tax=Xiphophorus couchianus TaxID=32473 RepID=A0A3B5MJ31_9TELE
PSPNRIHATEEFFEYDAEEFLVFLTLLITEGRTPEYSVKGRTEGLHCPPAQSGMPPLHKHECSDKLPQCRQARRTRSEVILLWRNNIPIMIEVMLLPDCCYGDECPPSDPISDPVIKQDALLLERWTLQAVPRQSGDRFIEEKTLLLAVRSYVFFSQLSAWLSASHGIVPRNILYRISAADEDLVWQFSQPPSEHIFPVPNVSQSVALQVRVQSLPRQPTYPTLACSIHTGLPPIYKNYTFHNGELPQVNIPQCQGSPLFYQPARSPTPSRSNSPSPLPSGKAGKWLYTALNGSSDPTPVDDYTCGTSNTDQSKAPIPEPLRSFKNLSMAESSRCPSPRPSGSETNPLIGSLLQERQEVIARIAQRLNFCDPTAPPLPPGLFATDSPHKAMWGGNHDDKAAGKTKELETRPYESVGRAKPAPFSTPVTETSRFIKRESSSPKPAACRKLRMAEDSLIAQAVQDITRLIQERLAVPPLSPRHSRSTTSNGCANGHVPSHEPQRDGTHNAASHSPVCTEKPRGGPRAERRSPRAQNGAQFTLEETSLNGQADTRVPCRLRASPQEKFFVSRNCASALFFPLLLQNIIYHFLHHSPLFIAVLQRPHSPSPLRPYNSWKKQNRHSLDATATKAFHPCTGLPLLSSPVPQRKNQTGYFDLDISLTGCKGLPWASGKRVCPKRDENTDESHQLFSASAPPASLSLLGNFEECVLNYRLEPLGTVEGFTAEVGASGSFCPSHLTLPVDVSFYSVSDDNAPSPYMGVINLESLGKRGYRVPASGTIQVTLFNPNKTVVKMFVVMYDLRAMPAGHQTFLRQRTFSVPVRRDANNQTNRKPLIPGQSRTLRYLIHLRFQSSKSGKLYLHRDIRLLFSRKSMEVDSGAAYELQSFTESPIDPPFSPRC